MPLTADGAERGERRMRWEYYPDGKLHVRYDRHGDPTTYEYDANGNLLRADGTSGAEGSGEHSSEVRIAYDGLDRETEIRRQKGGDSRWVVTRYSDYDLGDNVLERVDNAEEGDDGSTLKAGRRHAFVYDDSDWLVEQTDFGRKDGADADAPSDDRRISTSYFATAWEQERIVAKRDAGGFGAVKQRTTWSWFDNGKLKSLETRNGSQTLLESHRVSYEDEGGRYANGNAG